MFMLANEKRNCNTFNNTLFWINLISNKVRNKLQLKLKKLKILKIKKLMCYKLPIKWNIAIKQKPTGIPMA